MNKEIKRRIADAERVLKNTFAFDNPWDMECDYTPYTFCEEIDWNAQRSDDEEWTFMLARFGFMPNLAIAYLYTENEEFVQKGINLITSFINDNPFCEEKMKSSYRTLDSAIRIHNWQLFVSLCSTKYKFPSSFTSLFEKGLSDTCTFLDTHKREFLSLSNWGAIGYTYLAEAAINLKNTELYQRALELTESNLKYSVFSDGMQFEQSPMYHVQVLYAVLDLIYSLKKAETSVPKSLTDVAIKMSLACAKSIKPDCRQFLQADSDDTALTDLFTYATLVLEDGRFKFFGLDNLILPFSAEEIEKYNKIEVIKPDFNSAFLETSGNYYLRSGWGKDALTTHFKCGSLGSGHGHGDILHLDITKGSLDILTDSGRFTYTEKEERYELKRSRSHNTITVDDKDCYEISDSWGFSARPDFIQGFAKENTFAYYVSGINLGYYPVVVKREIVQIKDIAIFIFDTIKSEEEHTYKRYFHFDNKGPLSITENTVKYKDATLYLDNNEKLEKKKTLYSKHYNQMLEKESIIATSKGKSIVRSAVMTFDKSTTVEQKKVYISSNNREIENSISYTVKLKSDEINLLFTAENEIKGVDFITNGNVKGYGRIIATFNEQYEAVTC